MGQQGFWDLQSRQQKLESKKDFLTRLNCLVPWETLRPTLKKIRDKPRKSNAGRKPIDELLLFKMLVLQKLYNISTGSRCHNGVVVPRAASTAGIGGSAIRAV